jgi:hypothetical protein
MTALIAYRDLFGVVDDQDLAQTARASVIRHRKKASFKTFQE